MGIDRAWKLAVLAALAAGCAGADGATGAEDDLTSLTARQRTLTFEGVVYVEPGAGDEEVLEIARAQTQTAFGALLHSEVAVQSRELQAVDPASFRKREVRVIDTSVAGDPGRPMIEVRYRYTDNAVVPVAMSRKTALSLALLGQTHESNLGRVVELCTKNDAEARDDAANGLIWYDFDPSRASCRRAMEAEQRAIDADTAKLSDPRGTVPRSRVERLFVPTTMSLARAATATRATYPEYHRLFAGGVDRGALVVALINGRLSHHRVEAVEDGGYYEWMDALGVLFEAHPEFELVSVEPREDLTTATVDGRRVEGLRFSDFIQWTVYDAGWPAGLSRAQRKQLAAQVANKLDGRWVTFEKKVTVSIGDEPPRDFVLRLETLFGAEEDPAPHRRALRRGDVVVYNGHSYIGYGPLDPDNFRTSSFPGSYQLLFFDSCVSYNYYEKDFFALKAGGSANLDIITNGLEAPEYQSGAAEGAFLAKLLDGSAPSYQTLLEAARATDALRVVDGEIDNEFRPQRTAIRVRPR